MKYKLKLTKEAKANLSLLEKNIQKRIAQKLKFYISAENPLKHAKKLKTPFDDLFRFRIGDYRVIFEIDNKGNLTILTILTIKHRKNVYSMGG